MDCFALVAEPPTCPPFSFTVVVEGLKILHPSGAFMMDVEGQEGSRLDGAETLHHQDQREHEAAAAGPRELIVFAGETLSFLTGGQLRAPVHYVDERFMGKPRVSMPFFVRGRPDALLRPACVEAAGGKSESMTQAE